MSLGNPLEEEDNLCILNECQGFVKRTQKFKENKAGLVN